MKILVTEAIGAEGMNMLENSGHTIVKCFGATREEVLGMLGDIDAMVVRTLYAIDKELIDAAPNLKAVGMHGVGLNHIDVEYAKSKGIEVLNVPDGNFISVVELTIGLMLAVARKIPAVAEDVKAGNWRSYAFIGTELNGKTAGIIGLGRIGRRVAEICQSLGMDVVGYDPYIADTSGMPFTVVSSVEELVKKANVISLHVPLTPETKDMINEDMMDIMRDGTMIINVARGGIISEKMILKGLKSGKFIGAGIDCTEVEPVEKDNELLTLPNVVITPHMGARTEEAQQRVSSGIATKVLDVLAKA